MKKLSLIALFVLIFNTLNIFAAPLKNVERIMIQPNGDTLVCYASGDEFYNRLHDINGFTIVQNEEGYFVYADKNADNQIVATEYIAGRVDPSAVGLQPGIIISKEEYQRKVKAMRLDEYRAWKQNHRDGELNHGLFSNLTVFIRFNGDAEIQTPASTVNAMFNGNSDEDESMRKFYKQFTYNQLYINSHFYPEFNGEQIMSYEDIYPRNYYRPYNAGSNPTGYHDHDDRAQREFDLLERAIEYVKPMIPNDLNIDCNNDGFVDNMVFVVKGNVGDWADLLWPHQWWFYEREIFINGVQVYNFNFQLESAATYFTVSTLCHEMFHSLGAPDLYHYHDPYNLDPAGAWDLMCGTSNPPQSSCVWLKYRYGNWIDELPVISDYGTYTLEANTWEGGRRNGYLIPTSDPNQHYLLQFRDKNNFYDQGVPGSGITISRIDERYNGGANFNGNDTLNEVYVFQPGGRFHVQGTLASAHFNESVGRTEFNKNTPAFPWINSGIVDDTFNICNIRTVGHQMQFTFCPLNHEIIPNNLTVNVINHNQVDMKWDAVEGASSYKVYRDGQLIADNVTGVSYSETGNIGDGYHEYYVKSVCGGAISYRSEKQSVILGALAEISLQMTAEMEEGWRGAEVELSFDNAMPTRHFTIYNGEDLEKTGKIIVPAGTEVTVTWYSGWEEEKCHFSLSDTNTSLSDSDFKNGQSVRTFTAAASDAFAAPQNLTAIVDEDRVTLSWTSSAETPSFRVRRDGKVIADVTTSTFTDTNVPGSGLKLYEVAGGNGQSEWTSVSVFVMNYCADAPQLTSNYGGNKVDLSWNTPECGGKLNYADDDYITNIGSGSSNWAVKFTPDMLKIFDGQKITAIEMWDASSGNYTFKIHSGENATSSNVIHTEVAAMTGSGQWTKIPLSENVAFDATTPLWIEVKSSGTSSPGPVCRFVGDDNSALLKSGSSWKPLSYFGMDYSWMLRAYVEVPAEILNDLSYNIYRNGYVIATDVKSTSYTDDNLGWEQYCYTVAAVLNGGEYEHSNEVCGYADVNEVQENVGRIYPNPADEVLHVSGEFEHYEIFDVTGRKFVSSNEVTLSIKDWTSGIYIVRIFTREGNILTDKIVKR